MEAGEPIIQELLDKYYEAAEIACPASSDTTGATQTNESIDEDNTPFERCFAPNCKKRGKSDCVHKMCFQCCCQSNEESESAEPCSGHAQMLAKKIEEDRLITEALNNSYRNKTKFYHFEEKFMNYGETVVIFCLQDFIDNDNWSYDTFAQYGRRERQSTLLTKLRTTSCSGAGNDGDGDWEGCLEEKAEGQPTQATTITTTSSSSSSSSSSSGKSGGGGSVKEEVAHEAEGVEEEEEDLYFKDSPVKSKAPGGAAVSAVPSRTSGRKKSAPRKLQGFDVLCESEAAQVEKGSTGGGTVSLQAQARAVMDATTTTPSEGSQQSDDTHQAPSVLSAATSAESLSSAAASISHSPITTSTAAAQALASFPARKRGRPSATAAAADESIFSPTRATALKTKLSGAATDCNANKIAASSPSPSKKRGRRA